MINFKENVKIEDRYGTWYEIDRAKASDGKEYILFESEQYGDETPAILCIIPKDNQVRKVRGKRTRKEFIQIPKEFEVEETRDDIETALEQDFGLDVLVDEACVEECNEALNSENISDEEVDAIIDFFERQKRLWDSYPDIINDYFTSNGNYTVELDISTPEYIEDTEESLKDLCDTLFIDFFAEANPQEQYQIKYTFYPIVKEEKEYSMIEESVPSSDYRWIDDDTLKYKNLTIKCLKPDYDFIDIDYYDYDGEALFVPFLIYSDDNKELEDKGAGITFYVCGEDFEHEDYPEDFEVEDMGYDPYYGTRYSHMQQFFVRKYSSEIGTPADDLLRQYGTEDMYGDPSDDYIKEFSEKFNIPEQDLEAIGELLQDKALKKLQEYSDSINYTKKLEDEFEGEEVPSDYYADYDRYDDD